jgi:hypothetical protein
MKIPSTSLTAALLLFPLVLGGCAVPKVRIQPSEKLYVAETQTKLVAGIRRVEDLRPDAEKRSDGRNERPRPLVVNEQVYKNLKLSGLFQNILFEKFAEDQVDVVITPKLKTFSSESTATAQSAAALGIAVIPVVNLFYLAANGPIADQRVAVSIDLDLRYRQSTATVSAAKDATITLGLTDDVPLRTGRLEGDMLTDVIHDLISKMPAAMKPMER